MSDTEELTVITPDRRLAEHVRSVWRYRELLVGLVRKELKVRYKESTLGFAWSMLNPAMYLVVFYIVFKVFLESPIPQFAIFLLSGLLLWNLFVGSVIGATGSVVGNGSLVNKVYFPREILPLASVGANLVHFMLQSIVLLLVLIVFRYGIDLEYAWLLPLGLLTVLLFSSAVGIFCAALNVRARDLQHLVELMMLAWFWMTPIVYPWHTTASAFDERGLPTGLTLVNPLTAPVLAFQRAIYGVASFGDPPSELLPDASPLWYLRNLMIVVVVSSILLVLALRMFGRLEGSFAEEL